MPLMEAAAKLGCSRQTVYRLIDAGELEAVQFRPGCWTKVSRQSLAAFVQRIKRGQRKANPRKRSDR